MGTVDLTVMSYGRAGRTLRRLRLTGRRYWASPPAGRAVLVADGIIAWVGPDGIPHSVDPASNPTLPVFVHELLSGAAPPWTRRFWDRGFAIADR